MKLTDLGEARPLRVTPAPPRAKAWIHCYYYKRVLKLTTII